MSALQEKFQEEKFEKERLQEEEFHGEKLQEENRTEDVCVLETPARVLRTVPASLLGFQRPDEGDIQLQDMSKYPESFFLMRLHYTAFLQLEIQALCGSTGSRRSGASFFIDSFWKEGKLAFSSCALGVHDQARACARHSVIPLHISLPPKLHLSPSGGGASRKLSRSEKQTEFHENAMNPHPVVTKC
ncbi:hypothetical protein FQA47_018132 [Oryzias melastigma]|uniref:Uncharacterized protein n=1 Tax=Oryzias melastigma TaxID=30732 RepID=A0A834F437_ORYME|nr:hypothetical protein FQA47_018132 [Oryzias melastigma]